MLTRHPGHMGWLMDEIAARYPLFFVDSYTTSASVALSMAKEAGVPALRRDIFLDNEPTIEAVALELEKLKTIARQNGFAIGIGHPYPATLDVLEQQLPLLREEGFELISLGAYLELQTVSAIAEL